MDNQKGARKKSRGTKDQLPIDKTILKEVKRLKKNVVMSWIDFDWTAKELKAIDIRTRKIMTMAGIFHQKGGVDSLYLMRKDRGRGMFSVEDCVRMEEKSLARYIMRSKERLFGAASEGIEVEESGKEYKKQVMVERKEKLKKKQVYSKILNDIEEVGTKEMWQWLQGG